MRGDHLKKIIIVTPMIIVALPRHYCRLGIWPMNTADRIVEKMDCTIIMAAVGPCIPLTEAFKPTKPQSMIRVEAQ